MKKRLLLGLCAVLCICMVCFCLPKPRTVIQQFKYSELKTKIEIPKDSRVAEWSLEQKVNSIMRCGVDSEGYITSTAKYYGFVGIIEPLYSENCMRRVTANGDEEEALSPFKVYNDLQWRERQKECETTNSDWSYDGLEWRYGSQVLTAAKIKEILYLPPNSTYKIGDTIWIVEHYGIYDQRVPHYVEWTYSGRKCYVEKGKYMLMAYYDYTPLEDGETYFICGDMLTEKGKEEFYQYEFKHGFDLGPLSSTLTIFCLSDKTKPAGSHRSPEQLEADYAYIAEHFGY